MRGSTRLSLNIESSSNHEEEMMTPTAFHHQHQNNDTFVVISDYEELRTPTRSHGKSSSGSCWKRIQQQLFCQPDEHDPHQTDSEKLTLRQRLAKIGIGAVVSYSWISTAFHAITICISWYVYCSQYDQSPLVEWKGFLAVYAGFLVMNGLARPVRMFLAVATAPWFTSIVRQLQERWNLRRGVAVLVTMLLANISTFFVLLSGGIALAVIGTGVPIFPRKGS